MGLPIPMSRKHTYAYNVYTNCKHILNAINLILGRIEWLQFHLHVSILSALLPFTFIYSKYESIGYKTCYAWQFLLIDVGYFHSLPFHFDHMRREFPTNICVWCNSISTSTSVQYLKFRFPVFRIHSWKAVHSLYTSSGVNIHFSHKTG